MHAPAFRFRSLVAAAVFMAVTPVMAAPGGVPGKPGNTPPGGGEETATNNLSFPVVFTDGGITIPGDGTGTASVSKLDGVYYLWDGDPGSLPCDPAASDCASSLPYRVYVQKDPDNVWQAGWTTYATKPQTVSDIDVGDNLESVPWRTTSTVRVEFTPFTDQSTKNGWQMAYVSGQGTNEVWGLVADNTDSSTEQTAHPDEFTPPYATLYDGCMDLSLTKLETGAGDIASPPPAEGYTWDDDNDNWLATAYTRKVDYTAEINVRGRVLYGYNWALKRESMPPGVAKDGWWRLTFYNSCSTTSPLDFTTSTGKSGPTATTVEPAAEEGYSRTPVIDADKDLVFIDVYIESRSSGGGTGGGGGNGPGGPSNT